MAPSSGGSRPRGKRDRRGNSWKSPRVGLVNNRKRTIFPLMKRMIIGSVLAFLGTLAIAQETKTESKEAKKSASGASIFTDGNARTMSLSIPAPRGLVLDREGRPLAQTKMAYHLALDFTRFTELDSPEKAIVWAQTKIAESNALTGNKVTISNEKLNAYYRHRRWIPRIVSQVFDGKKAQSLEEKLPDGLVILPVYMRHYPEKSLAAHLVGYVGTKTRLPDGPINDGDPLFESVQGKSGFEKVYDKELRGIPGRKKVIFDTEGNKVLEEISKKPRPGGNVVTTLDLDWQRHAESVLRSGCKRGAMVVIDVITGEVLVMASRPSFDLNEFIPYITNKRYEALKKDPAAPLYARSYQSQYPPASTFKPVVGLAAITTGAIKPWTLINCPYFIEIGGQKFRNHSEGHQGDIPVQRALAKSVNPWFYQVGIMTGPQNFLNSARKLGYGSRTGLPLVGETPGNVPTPGYIEKRMGRPTTDGDTANLSIGQGLLLASPLQVAQSMAGIANGVALMELRLTKQIQDFHGRVLEAPLPKKRFDLDLDPEAVEVVHQGMEDVVHAPYGTGRNAALSFTIMCGKTGTAQWGPKSKEQGLAWFSGFFPRDNPRYAFAVVYEGLPHEKVSGGRKAAPMVKKFFNKFKDEIKEQIIAPARAAVIDEGTNQPITPIPNPNSNEGDFRAIPRAQIINEDEDIPVAEVITEDDLTPEAPVDSPPAGKLPETGPPAPPVRIPDALPVNE